MTNNIAIIGAKGYVGKAMVNFFKDHYPVTEIEKDWAEPKFPAADLYVICVPTPMADDGSCDWSLVEAVCALIPDGGLAWLRSTVPPGTTDKLRTQYPQLRFVFSPEYIGEGKYWQPYKFNTDEREAPWFIFGGDSADCSAIIDLVAPIAGPTKTYRTMTAKEAETVKYMENIYFAVKVTFANEMLNACRALGVNYWTVRDGWALDPRVDPMHTAAFVNAPGFGGKCLPKDLNAFIAHCEQAGYTPEFFKEVWKSNKRFRKDVN